MIEAIGQPSENAFAKTTTSGLITGHFIEREKSDDKKRSSDLPPFLLQRTMLDVEFVQLSDAGRVRGHNEDYLGHVNAGDAGWLFALADGVGGHDKGEVAAHTAVESVLAGFREAPSGESHAALLPRLVQTANLKVYET